MMKCCRMIPSLRSLIAFPCLYATLPERIAVRASKERQERAMIIRHVKRFMAFGCMHACVGLGHYSGGTGSRECCMRAKSICWVCYNSLALSRRRDKRVSHSSSHRSRMCARSFWWTTSSFKRHHVLRSRIDCFTS